MSEPITPDRIQQALEKAGKLDNGYGPLGASLALFELRDLYGEVKTFLGEAWAMKQALDAEILAREAYKTALETHVAAQEQRAAALASSLPPQKRRLQEQLETTHQELRTKGEELARLDQGLFNTRLSLSEAQDELKGVTQQVAEQRTQARRVGV